MVFNNNNNNNRHKFTFTALLYLNEPSLKTVMVYSGYISLALTG